MKKSLNKHSQSSIYNKTISTYRSNACDTTVVKPHSTTSYLHQATPKRSIHLDITQSHKSTSDLTVRDSDLCSEETMVSDLRSYLNDTVMQYEWKSPQKIKAYEDQLTKLVSQINLLKFQNAKNKREYEEEMFKMKRENQQLKLENDQLRKEFVKHEFQEKKYASMKEKVMVLDQRVSQLISENERLITIINSSRMNFEKLPEFFKRVY